MIILESANALRPVLSPLGSFVSQQAKVVLPEKADEWLQSQVLPQESVMSQSVSKEALKLFQANATTAALLTTAQAMGVKVFDGSQMPWVDEYCRQRGVEGFVFTPFSFRYPNANPPQAIDNDAASSGKDEMAQAQTELKQMKHQGLFVKKDAPPDIVMHELYHVLQERHGFPFGLNPEADATADRINDSLNKLEPKALMTRLGLLGKVALDSMTPRQDPPSSPVALSLYRQMKREMEADSFFIRHSKQLGLSSMTRLKHMVHYWTASRFKLQLAYLLDKDPELLAKLDKAASV